MSKRLNRIPIMMSDDELNAVDDWRFANRLGTRSDAIRRLCAVALIKQNEVSKIGGGE